MNTLCRENNLTEESFPFQTHTTQGKVPAWQKAALAFHTRRKMNWPSKKQKNAYTFYSLKDLIVSLQEMGMKVSPLPSSTYGRDFHYLVDKKAMTHSQMLFLLNQKRYEQGMDRPILIEGVTYEG